MARGNSYQVWWAPDGFGPIWKKDETLALILTFEQRICCEEYSGPIEPEPKFSRTVD
jgi:hypothetical protein